MRGRYFHYDCSPSVWELGPWLTYEMAPSPPETRVGVVYFPVIIVQLNSNHVHLYYYRTFR